MRYTVQALADLVGGELVGNGEGVITSAVPLAEATADSITFVAEKKHLPKLAECAVGAVVVPLSFEPLPVPAIRVADPLSAMLTIAGCFKPRPTKPIPRVDPRAAIDPSAHVGDDCYVGPFAVLEANVVLGAGCVIHPHAVIREGCRLGDQVEIHPHAVLYPQTVVGHRSIIHGGAVIGSDGFGYRQKEGRHVKIPQVGCVEIGEDVEVGAGSTIDRATFGSTRIGSGSKIDNQVMIAHNCQIGKHNIFVAQSGMAGSCTTGEGVILAGKAGVADHVNIGAGARLGASAGVFTDVPAGQTYMGAPAKPEREAKRHHLALERVPEMKKQLDELRSIVDELRPPQRAAG